MVKEVIGYTHTMWTCPSCGTKNPGPIRLCKNCGAEQPADVQFEQASAEALITDQAEITAAQKGPDVHCPYCGTRNAADAVTCSQCGGNLKESTARQAGAILGAHSDTPGPPVKCPSCGTLNPADAPNCSSCGAALGKQPEDTTASAPNPPSAGKGCRGGVIALIGMVLLAVIIGIISCWPRSAVGQVASVSWQRSIPILELRAVQHQDWEQDIPAGADISTCQSKQYQVQDNPVGNATKVCGTPYSRDLGNGRAEVLQDCEYVVYAEYCRYTVQEWVEIDTLQAEGSDYSPAWPRANLGSSQREGKGIEIYRVVFNSGDKQYTWETKDEAAFQRCQPGTTWRLVISAGRVTSISPGN
ncbi:MAG: double zinc ribbon domain-containing protein [Anaerolineae bacterium]